MKIERVVIRDLRALKARDDAFAGPDGVFPSACLRGLNGSGKTTYLEAIAHLWQWFRRCTQRRAYVSPAPDSLLVDAARVAVLFTDLPGPRSRMWIAWERDPAARLHQAGDADSALVVEGGRLRWDPNTLAWWEQAFARAESGGEPIPNIVMIEAENKFVPVLRRDELTRSGAAPAFFPVARNSPTARGASHLEGVMRTLFLARPEQWKLLAAEFTRLRPGLRLMDRFEETTQRPLLELRDGTVVTVDRLSAGERSVLINLCMVLRWLGPGGIVLLDEPELHQHVSLMRGSIAVTESLVARSFGGQLLVASHAPEVWDHFRMSGALVDLDT